MPCYSGGPSDERVRTEYVDRYINGVNPSIYTEKIKKLNDRIGWLQAALCALITELENKGVANEVISQASKSGLIGLMDFWVDHSKEDEARLAKKFHEFSEHEQAMIKKMIGEGKF